MLLDLLLPSRCASCEALGPALCAGCRDALIRLAPPLTITAAEADWLLERLLGVLADAHADAEAAHANLRFADTAVVPTPPLAA